MRPYLLAGLLGACTLLAALGWYCLVTLEPPRPSGSAATSTQTASRETEADRQRSSGAQGGTRRAHWRVVGKRVRSRYPGIDDTWADALAFAEQERFAEALALLVLPRRRAPAFFADKDHPERVEGIERGAIDHLARLVRGRKEELARAYAAEIEPLIFDEKRRARIVELLKELERLIELHAPIEDIDETKLLAAAATEADREQLLRHLGRFSDVASGERRRWNWVDDQLAALREIPPNGKTKPLPVADDDAAEARRLEQLEKLRRRNAVGVLDPIHAGLAWLALHQADDGSFSDREARKRCKALGHKDCLAKKGVRRFPVGTTGLAVLAFLDFRDQDMAALFEPTLSRGVEWLLAQQRKDGSFPSRSSYSTAIALMALGQAARSSQREDIGKAVVKGLKKIAGQAGPAGGLRYTPRSPGDLSVTGWYVQAVEAARDAELEIPDGLEDGLERFVTEAWVKDNSFRYVLDKGPQPSLESVGMLSRMILDPEIPPELLDLWRHHLQTEKLGGRLNLYELYYDVRVQLALDGELSPQRRKLVFELAETSQRTSGPAAGMLYDAKERWIARNGVTTFTAFAVLTLEHSLYRR